MSAKRRQDWCDSKEKNINAAWEVIGEPRHDGVHHHTQPQHSVNGAQDMTSFLGGCCSTCSLCPHPIDVSRARYCFLKKMIMDVREESSRTRFRELKFHIFNCLKFQKFKFFHKKTSK